MSVEILDRRTIVFTNAPVLFKNFKGEVGPNNRNGMRTFNVVIEDPKDADELMELGYNVKIYIPSNGNPPVHHMQVKVNYRGDRRDPDVWVKSGRNLTAYDEDSIGCLDDRRIMSCDVVVTGSDYAHKPDNWDRSKYSYEEVPKPWLSAYLSSERCRFVCKSGALDHLFEDEAPSEPAGAEENLPF